MILCTNYYSTMQYQCSQVLQLLVDLCHFCYNLMLLIDFGKKLLEDEQQEGTVHRRASRELKFFQWQNIKLMGFYRQFLPAAHLQVIYSKISAPEFMIRSNRLYQKWHSSKEHGDLPQDTSNSSPQASPLCVYTSSEHDSSAHFSM